MFNLNSWTPEWQYINWKCIPIPEFMDPWKTLQTIIYIYPKMDDRLFPAISWVFPALSWEFPAQFFWKNDIIHEISKVPPERGSWATPAKLSFLITIPEKCLYETPLQNYHFWLLWNAYICKLCSGDPCKTHIFWLPWNYYPWKVVTDTPAKPSLFDCHEIIAPANCSQNTTAKTVSMDHSWMIIPAKVYIIIIGQ